MVAASPATRLPLHVNVGWAIGSCCSTFLLFVTSTFYLRFMTDYAGLPAVAAGGLLASMKLFEMVVAPTVGIVTDNAPAKFGRRRPFLLIGAALAALSLLLIFTAPAGLDRPLLIAYVVLALACGSLGYTIFNVPYLAMLAEMTEDPNERAKLVSSRVFVLSAAQFAAGGVAPLLINGFGSDRSAYGSMAMVFASMIVLAGIICFVTTKGVRATTLVKGEGLSFFAQLPTVFRSRIYRYLVLAKATMLVGSTAHTVTATYYVHYVLGASDKMLSLFLFAYSGGMVLSQLVWIRLAKARGKVFTFIAAAGVYTVISLIWSGMAWHVPGWLIILLSLLNGAGAGGMLMASEALLPDAIEDDCRTSGLRREGTLAAGFSFAEKAANAIGVALVGVLLSWFGYDAAIKGAPGVDQVRGIMAAFGLMPALFIAASCLWWFGVRRRVAKAG